MPAGAPLSFAQERLWFLDQLSPGSAAYNISLVVDLEGALDLDAFTRAVAAIVDRHEALRTIFPSERGVPFQTIEPPGGFALPLTDLSSRSADVAAAETDEIIAAEIRRPFDLAHGPIFRGRLLRLAPDRHVFIGAVHHIVYDAWSNGIVFRELKALYSAFAAGQPSPLEPLRARFTDFAAAQRERLQGEALAREMRFWTSHLGVPPRLDLPTDRRRPPVQSLAGGREHLVLPDSLIESAERFSRREGVTLFITLLSAYAVLLHRNAGQDVMVIGTPIANRAGRDMEQVVGFFLNMLPLRLDVTGDPSFRELVQRTRRLAFSAYAHQELPFEKLVHELRPERNPGRTPIIDTVFVLDNNPGAVGGTIVAGDLKLTRRVVDNGTAKFDLGLLLFRRDGGRRATLEYNRDLFDSRTAVRLLDQYRRILEAALHDPDACVSALPAAADDEVVRMLGGWNGGATSYPRNRSIPELVAEISAGQPDAVAVVDAAGELTYRELDRSAARVARRLIAAGVQPGDRVGLWPDRSAQTIVRLLGILKAGAAYVPLDPSFPRDRLAALVRRAEVRIVIATSMSPPNAPLDDVVAVEIDRDRLDEREILTAPPADALAYVLFTSGTTGEPKPVGVPHRAIVRLAYGMPEVPTGPGARVLHAAPLAFDASTFEIWAPLLRGGAVVVSPSDLLAPAELEQVLTTRGVTALWLTASLFNLIVDERPEALRGVRHVLTGGEALSVRHVERALAALPDTILINGYGPTEATTFATRHVIQQDDVRRPSIPIGRPLDNTRVYVLDAAMRLVPPGMAGELWIGGDAVAAGYLGDRALDAQRFRDDPFAGGTARMYRTGDRVRFLPDGELEFLGRLDDQLKIRGFRIEPGDVEAALMAHPGVSRAAVAAHELATGRALVAYVVPAAGAEPPAPAELRAFLAARLPPPFVPHFYEVVPALPLADNGKIDRRALRPSTRENLPRGATPDTRLTSAETVVAAVWRALLGPAAIDAGSNFFELGGDSLLAAQAAGRLSTLTGAPIGVRSLFEFPTLSAFAKVLEPHLSAVPGLAAGDDVRVRERVASDQNARAPERLPAVAAHAPGEIEAVVAEIWRGVLNVPRIDLDDNFFELGGHSLLAVRVVAEIEARFGVALPPASLFERGTLRAQCRLLRQPAAPVEWSSIVAMRPSGSKPPLFLTHAIGGEVLSYQPLVARLASDRPVYGLRVQTERGRPVHRSVEEMAASYVAAIRRIQACGPYYLGGYSGGGVIAFEMAQQLRSSGEEVASLVMLDCPAPGGSRAASSVRDWLSVPVRAVQWMIDDDLVRDGWPAAWARARSKLAEWARRWTGGAQEVDIRYALGLWRYPPESRGYLEAMHAAIKRYRPAPYDGSVAVIRARSRKLLAVAPRAADLGWSRVVTGPVSVAVVPGAHDTIVREPRVRLVADMLTRLLDESGDARPPSPFTTAVR
jgi:amino acid adenylation domain-containing protein